MTTNVLTTSVSGEDISDPASARMTMNVLTVSVSGEDISDPASDRKIAKVLGLKPRRLFGRKRIRTQILKTEKSCFEITKRKPRSDAVSENVKRTVFDFPEKVVKCVKSCSLLQKKRNQE